MLDAIDGSLSPDSWLHLQILPDNPPIRVLYPLLEGLETLGWTTGATDDGLNRACLPLPPAADCWQSWLEQTLEALAQLLDAHPPIRLVIDQTADPRLDEGLLAFLEFSRNRAAVESLWTALRPGQLLLHPAVSARLEPLDGRLRATGEPKMRIFVRPAQPIRRLRDASSQTKVSADTLTFSSPPTQHWLLGSERAAQDALFTWKLRDLVERHELPQTPVLVRGDRLRCQLTAPAPGVALLLLLRDNRLFTPEGSQPVTLDAAGQTLTLDQHLSDASGQVRPVLLLLPVAVRLHALLEACKRPELLEVDALALSLLQHLADAGLPWSQVLVGPAHRQIRLTDLPLPDAWKSARQQLNAGQHQNALALLKALDPPTSEKLKIQLELELAEAERLSKEITASLTRLEKLRARAASGSRSQLARLYVSEAIHWRSQNELDRAQECLESALSLMEAQDDPCGCLQVLDQLGWLRYVQQRLLDARQVYQRALPVAIQCGDSALIASLYSSLGSVIIDLGHLDEAETLLCTAIAAAEASREVGGLRRLLGELGFLLLERHRPQEALVLFERQLDIARETGNEGWAQVPRISRGRALLALERFEEARTQLLSAIVGLSPVGYSKIFFIEARLALSELALRSGDLDEAARWLEGVEAPSLQEHAEGRWRVLYARGRLKALTLQPDALDVLEEGVRSVEARRGALPLELRNAFLDIPILLYELWIQELLRAGASVESLLLATERARARTFLDALTVRHHGVLPEQVVTQLDPGAARGLAQLELAELRKGLHPGDRLLSWFCLPEETLVFVIGRDVLDLKRLSLKRSQLHEHCQHLTNLPRPKAPTEAFESALETLSGLLLKPLEPWLRPLQERSRLYVMPHGPLYQVPWHALWDPCRPNEARYLCERLLISSTPSVASLWLLKQAPPPTGTQTVVLCGSTQGLEDALPEAREVTRLTGGILIEPERANLSTLVQYAGTARRLHLITHGRSRAGSTRAALALTATRKEGLEPRQEYRALLDFGQDTGLEVPDIIKLPLSAELVVLSACLGDAGELSASGEGPDLLSWAFLAAGSRTVLASQWPVGDEQTRALMLDFYRRQEGDGAVAEAFHEARLSQLERTREGGHGNPAFGLEWLSFGLLGILP